MLPGGDPAGEGRSSSASANSRKSPTPPRVRAAHAWLSSLASLLLQVMEAGHQPVVGVAHQRELEGPREEAPGRRRGSRPPSGGRGRRRSGSRPRCRRTSGRGRRSRRAPGWARGRAARPWPAGTPGRRSRAAAGSPGRRWPAGRRRGWRHRRRARTSGSRSCATATRRGAAALRHAPSPKGRGRRGPGCAGCRRGTAPAALRRSSGYRRCACRLSFFRRSSRLWTDIGRTWRPTRRAVRLFRARCSSRKRGRPPGLTTLETSGTKPGSTPRKAKTPRTVPAGSAESSSKRMSWICSRGNRR